MEPSNAKQITGFEHALYDINDGCPDDGGELRLIKERDDE